jgi:hypothetical protein
MRPKTPNLGAIAAALIAMLMLTYASVASSVMQVEMAASAGMGPLCLAAPGPSNAKSATHHGKEAVCPYCSAAAHAPVLTSATPLRLAVSVVFSAYPLVSSHGPRGPPALQPRARGPPPSVPTLI